jgi:hypothetical protein
MNSTGSPCQRGYISLSDDPRKLQPPSYACENLRSPTSPHFLTSSSKPNRLYRSDLHRPIRSNLKKSFGFDCTCELCSLSESARAASDDRQREIKRLDDLLGDGSRLFSHPDRCLEDVHTLLTLLEAENITDARVPRAYYDAFQIAIAHGDQARARVFAQRAYEGRLCCEGDDSSLTARMKSLVARPAEHRLFGTSSRWRLSENMIPKTLEGEKFEAWLWRPVTPSTHL